MTYKVKIILACVFIPCFFLCQLNAEETMDAINIKNPSNKLITGGQPSQQDFHKLKALGVSKIINLRPESEGGAFDESVMANKLGMGFDSIPVSDETDLTREKVQLLDEALRGEDKVFVHCKSGNRVGALFALRAYYIEGLPVKEALDVGRRAGLGSLEAAVEHIMKDAQNK